MLLFLNGGGLLPRAGALLPKAGGLFFAAAAAAFASFLDGRKLSEAPPAGALFGAGLLYKFLSNSGASPAAADGFSVVALYKSSFLNEQIKSTF